MDSALFENFSRLLRWLNERNIIAAFLSLISIVLISGALAEQEWIYLDGGRCPLNHLGTSLFYGWGYFEYWYSKSNLNLHNAATQPPSKQHLMYRIGGHTYVDCVTPKIVDLFHALIAVCFVALVCSLAAFFVDVVVARKSFPAWLQRTSIFNILTVIVTSIVISLACWITVLVDEQQRETSDNPADVQTAFEDGFYLVTSAAIVSIFAVVANVVKSTLDLRRRLEDQHALLETHQREDNESANRDLLIAAMNNARLNVMRQPIGPQPPLHMFVDLPPPPPYAP